MQLAYEYPLDQNPPSLVFDSDELGQAYEVALFVVDEHDNLMTDEEGNPRFMDWQPVLLSDHDNLSQEELTSQIKMELGYWDESQDWEFVSLAVSEAKFMHELFEGNGHAYITGDLNPPTQDPWYPSIFTVIGATIPEPSTGALFLLGTALLFTRKRKHS